MVKNLRFSIAVLLVLVLVSWGYDGHHAVGFIAQRHLTEKAAEATKQVLGDDLAAVSTYADDIKEQGPFKYTALFHYIDLPSGLTYEEFQTRVKGYGKPNIYSAIAATIRDLENPEKDKLTKAFALKMLIHLVGDAHQPLHVGHEEDRGGNKVAIKFFGNPTDLHGLWDQGIILRQQKSFKDFAISCDNATPAQIKKWQSDSVMVWLWESYQISNILYQEAATDPNFGEDYYNEHLPILKTQIDKGGIRLAGLLNEIYK